MPRRRTNAAAVVFALLVLATAAAFAYAQHLKRDPLIIDRVEFGHGARHTFAPVDASCHRHAMRIKFRTTTSNHGTVQVLAQPGGKVVDTLVRDRYLKRYSYHVLHWNGLDSAGKLVPAGRYKLRITLEDEDRVLALPGTIRLHIASPQGSGRRCFYAVGSKRKTS